MAWNQFVLEALENLAFNFEQREEQQFALTELTEVNLSLSTGATNFRKVIYKHRKILGLPENHFGQYSIYSLNLHEEGEGEYVLNNNFRALQCLAGEKRVELGLEFIDFDDLTQIATTEEKGLLRNLLGKLNFFGKLGRTHHWLETNDDVPLLSTSALRSINNKAKYLLDDKEALFERFVQKLKELNKDQQNINLVDNLITKTRELLHEDKNNNCYIQVKDKTYRYDDFLIHILDKTYRVLQGRDSLEQYNELANMIEGKPDSELQSIGITMLLLSACLGIVGIAFITAAAIGAGTISIGSGAAAFGMGNRFFNQGKRQGLSQAMHQIIHAVKKEQLGCYLYVPELEPISSNGPS